MAIAHSPDPASVIITHEQRPIGHHEQAHRATPARAIGELPAGHKVLDRGRLAVLHVHAHDLRAGGLAAVPGAVIRHKGIAPVVGRERRTGIEHEPKRSRVCLEREGGRLYPRAVGARVFGVRLAREIALRPAVPPAVAQDVEAFGRRIIAQIIAVIVVRPQFAGARVECHPDRIAQPGGKRVRIRAIEVVASHGGARQRVVAYVAR